MYKRVKPITPDAQVPAPPHGDRRILHAPGECRYCDKFEDWQALRQLWGIAFTGYTPEGTELPCPADHAREREQPKKGEVVPASKAAQGYPG